MTTETIERRSGISVWRQIADRIRMAINAGEFDDTGALPGEMALARRFQVNRHTVRSAIAALANEGVLRVEQGRGTFIARRSRLKYPIGRRTRFTEGLAGQARALEARLKAVQNGPADAEVARALELETGAPVTCLETLHYADGVPVSSARNWFDATRFPQIGDLYRELGSVTACLKRLGVADYVRISTRISAHHAEPELLDERNLSAGAVVLKTEGVNAEMDGRRLEYSVTCFAADRIELDIDHTARQFSN